MGHSRLSAISPLDTAHMTSTETVRLSCHSRHTAGYLSKAANFNIPTCIWCPAGGDADHISPNL